MRNLIIARYDEQLDWLDNITECNIYVYNKGDRIERQYKQLDNIGREAHTYLYHILNEQPADYNIFVQADPFDHCSNPIFEINYLESDYQHLSPVCGQLWCDSNGLPHHRLPLRTAFKSILGYCPETIEFIPGACFIVSKQRWESIERKVYELAYNLSVQPNGAWILERMWSYLWS